MSVPVQTPYKKYTAAPGATVFPTTFRVVLAGDLQVRVDTVVVTSGFTLSALGAPSGLDVTFTAPMVGGEVVELQRIIPKSRVTDYQQLGDFNASTVNADIDRTWMSIQELGEVADRTVKVPIGSTLDPDQLIADLLAVQASAEGSANDAEAAQGAAAASAAAAAASAASTGLPSLIGKALQWLRVKADETGYEIRSLVQTREDLGIDSLTPPVRQTVLSGPVDSSGFSNFGGSTGGATLTTSATLKATAAAGGDINYQGSIVNPAFTSPAGTGTGYLMLAITAAGVVSASVRTLAPAYQWGGAYSTTAGQLTFNIQEMTAKAGNGASAVQVFEVCIGECPYTAGVWSGTPVWYALMGRYDSGYTATLPAAGRTSKNHNIGVVPRQYVMQAENTTAAAGYVLGDVILPNTGSDAMAQVLPVTSKTISAVGGVGGTWYALNAASGVLSSLISADWKWKLIASRGW